MAAFSTQSFADGARFDLTGPKVDVRVTRAGVTLPVASVPNLQPGDRIWLHPDLPQSQSVRYLMVLVFLRGTTNPPPDSWFTRIATWEKKVRDEGVEVTVPAEAQQAVIFLAPVTGGDFTTLRSAVQGRPGIFVRASQDLAAAGFEEARIEKYIASMKELSPSEAADPKQLQDHSNLIASTLALKPNGDCMKLPPDQQYTCLTQSGSQSLLDDGHGQSIVDVLTGGTSQGLIGTASTTQLAGGGLYSAYVGSIVDLVHILGGLHVAQYQYIPAIAFPQEQALNLRLNTPPSFHNPKSVIVIGLPSVQQTTPPPLRASDPKFVSCLAKPGVVLPVEGAPLVFSTAFAHDLVLHINYPAGTKPDAGHPQDVPLTPDAFHGGLVLAPAEKRRPLPAKNLVKVSLPATPVDAADPAAKSSTAPVNSEALASAELTGTVEGFWGFDTFTGPTMPLQETPGREWKLADEGSSDHWLIAGKGRHIELASTGTACIENIALEPGPAKSQKATWKPADKPNTVDVTLDIPEHDPAALHLAVSQFGVAKPASVKLVAYSEPAKLDALYFHAGDSTATLAGSGLDEVREVELGGATFKPAEQGSGAAQPNGKAELNLNLTRDAKAPAASAGSSLTAHVALKDGRTLNLPVAVEGARPEIKLISHADVPPDAPAGAAAQLKIKLGGDGDLPVGDALMFSLKSGQPFPRTGAIEVASPDNSLHTRLSLADSANSSLILEDPQTLLATLQPLKAFGPSAFGPIRLRAVAPDGTTGDWVPLVTLVRLPTITSVSCPASAPPSAAREPAPATSDTASGDAPAQSSTPDTDPAQASGASSTGSPATSSSETPAPGGDKPASGPQPAAPQAASATSAAASPAANSSAAAAPTCTLTGSGLYFIDSIASTGDFKDAVHVPEGFVGNTISVPAPSGAVLYLRLRDEPGATDTISLPAGPL